MASSVAEMARRQLPKTRPDHEQHSSEADQDRERSPPADRLSEEWDRKDGHEERRQKDQRIDLGKRQGRERQGAEDAGQNAGDSAHHDQTWAMHPEHVAPALVRLADEGKCDTGDKRREEADLENRHAAADRLHGSVAAREDRHGEEAEKNAFDHGRAD